MARGAVLLTGAAGMFGRELVHQLLADTPLDCYLLIHKQGRGLGRARLLGELFRLKNAPKMDRRVHVVEGDVTQSRFGLPLERYRELTREISSVLHAAAATRFDLSLSAARRINVRGMRSALSFASDCRRLDRLGLMSTVYVSGRRTGRIFEAELNHGAGFVNTYEQSKYEAEEVARAGRELPVATYRLSTLLGDSRSGRTTHLTAPHHALRVMHLGLASMVPGKPGCLVDLIPTDFAAAAVCTLFSDHFIPGKTFHVVAGDECSLPLGQLIEECHFHLGRLDSAWAARRHPVPAIGSERAFQLLVRSAQEARNPLVAEMYRGLMMFAGQFSYPKSFDATNLRFELPDFQRRLPDVRELLEKVLRYCLDSRWGRDVTR